MRAAFVLLVATAMLAPQAAACSLAGTVTNPAFLVRPIGTSDVARVAITNFTSGGTCEISDPVAINGSVIAWAEPRDAYADSVLLTAALDRPAAHLAEEPVGGRVSAVAAWSGHVAYFVDGSDHIAVNGERTRGSVPVPDGRVIRVILHGPRAAIETGVPSGDHEAFRLTVLDLETSAALLNTTPLLDLGLGNFADLRAVDGDRVLVDGTLLDITTRSRTPLALPQGAQFVALDQGYAYAFDSASATAPDGSAAHLDRAPLDGSGAWQLVEHRPARPVAVDDGRLVFGSYDVTPFPPALAWQVPAGGWAGAPTWVADTLGALDLHPGYIWGDAPNAGSAIESVGTDAGEIVYNLTFEVRQANDATRFIHFSQRVAHVSNGTPFTLWIAPDDLPRGVEVQDHGRALALLGPPGALPNVSALSAALALPNASFARVENATAEVRLFEDASDRFQFLLDRAPLTMLEARGALASESLNTARVWVLPNGSVVAFRTTPWIDISSSHGLLTEDAARATLLGKLGAAAINATLERASLAPIFPGATPHVRFEWRVRLAPTVDRAWTSERAVQDAATGELMQAPDEFALDPALLPTQPTAPPSGEAPSAQPPTRAVPALPLWLGVLTAAWVAARRDRLEADR